MFNKINQIIIVSFLMILISCKPNNVLTMERGIYFYENNDFHEASNQFKKVILNYSSDITSLKEKNVEILAQAYHQLALCQSRLAYESNNSQDKKLYYLDAIKNINQAESLAIKPKKIEEYRETKLLINQKAAAYLD